MFLVLQTPRARGAEQPANTWCQHCPIGKGGCAIYPDRPEKCQNFGCGWLTDPALGDTWFPARAKMYLTFARGLDGQQYHLLVVDPSYPNRWRETPYFEALKRMAIRRRVVVSVGAQAYVIQPEQGRS